SYHFLFYTNAFMSLIAGILFIWYFKNRKGHAPDKSNGVKSEAQIKVKSAYADRTFLIFSFFIAIYAFCLFQILNTLHLFYKDIARMTEKELDFLMAFNLIVVFVLDMKIQHFAEISDVRHVWNVSN